MTSRQSGVRCYLSKHTPNESNMLVKACILDAQGEGLDDDGGVIVDAVLIDNTFG